MKILPPVRGPQSYTGIPEEIPDDLGLAERHLAVALVETIIVVATLASGLTLDAEEILDEIFLQTDLELLLAVGYFPTGSRKDLQLFGRSVAPQVPKVEARGEEVGKLDTAGASISSGEGLVNADAIGLVGLDGILMVIVV